MNDGFRDMVLDAINPEEILQRLGVRNVSRPKANGNVLAECPFCHEGGKERKLYVSVERAKQFSWKCFRCGRGGDIFRLVMDKDNKTFVEALELLAGMVHVVRPEDLARVKNGEHTEAAVQRFLTAKAMEWHEALLAETTQAAFARNYLVGRGISEESIRRFKLGYATHIPKIKDREMLVKSGLYAEAEGGRIYPVFDDAITMPVFQGSSVVTLTSRRVRKATYTDAQGNVHEKRPHIHLSRPQRVFFNQDAARADRVIVVESPLDAITFEQHGFPAVATMGCSSFKEGDVYKFRRDGEVWICFDPDAPGQEAVGRFARVLLAGGISDIRVVTFCTGPDGEKVDANDYFRWYSADDFEHGRAVAGRCHYIDWALGQALKDLPDNDWLGVTLSRAHQVRPLLHELYAVPPLMRHAFAERISYLSGMSPAGVLAEIEAADLAADARRC